MSLYALIEPMFDQTNWYHNIFYGLLSECRKRRILLIRVHSLSEIPNSLIEENSPFFLFVIGAHLSWLKKALRECSLKNITPILVGNQIVPNYTDNMNCVSSNIQDSMRVLISYLSSLGKTKTALYGVDEESLADNWKAESFIQLASPMSLSIQDRIFMNSGSLKDCFENFYSMMEHFDSIICTNDFAAISFLQNLKEYSPKKLEDIMLVSYSNTLISKLYAPSITSISMDFSSMGKMAMTLYDILSKNPDVSSIHLMVKDELLIRETTLNAPYNSESTISSPIFSDDYVTLDHYDQFYQDEVVSTLNSLEVFLTRCDVSDYTILLGLMNNKTYEQIGMQHYFSIDSIKYRMRKMMANSHTNNRRELLNMLKKYISPEQLKEYIKTLSNRK